MKKVITICFLILINCLLDSCTSEDTICFDIEISNIKNFDLPGKVELNEGDTIMANNFALLLDAKTVNETCFLNYDFGGSLLAEEPGYLFSDELINVSIKSNSELNANYPVESELKDLFIPIKTEINCVNNNPDCFIDYFSVFSFNSLEQLFNEVISQELVFQNNNEIFLFSLTTEELISTDKHEFTIRFEFTSGKIIEFKTEEIILQ